MNPYIIAAALAAVIGAFLYGRHTGKESSEAATARDERIAQVAYEAGQRGAAGEIQKIEVKNVIIKQELEKQVFTETVYRDCKHTPAALGLLNDALAGPPAQSPGGR